MKFIDEVKVFVYGGAGGAGATSWRREKYLPKGGPNGGNGGAGGAVIFKAVRNKNTLIDLSFNPIIKAKNGAPGGSGLKDGANGKDALVQVPVGTQVFYNEKIVADLNTENAHWVAARGGRGGKGNNFFKSSTLQAPDFSQTGEPGEEFSFKLVLKSVADIGLVGLPNVGKSTLVKSITKATPKIADYPFTTLKPHLGVILSDVTNPLVIADIPGLIPEASKGKGLGIQFLKHIERTKILLHLIDLSLSEKFNGIDNIEGIEESVIERECFLQYELIEKELSSFSKDLIKKPRAIVFSKLDLLINEIAFKKTYKKLEEKTNLKVLGISSKTSFGLKKLCNTLSNMVENKNKTQI